MQDEWKDPDEADDAWRGDAHQPPDLTLGDDDAWRGDAHLPIDEPWRVTTDMCDWPEWNAGPEYHMWKKRAEDP